MSPPAQSPLMDPPTLNSEQARPQSPELRGPCFVAWRLLLVMERPADLRHVLPRVAALTFFVLASAKANYHLDRVREARGAIARQSIRSRYAWRAGGQGVRDLTLQAYFGTWSTLMIPLGFPFTLADNPHVGSLLYRLYRSDHPPSRYLFLIPKPQKISQILFVLKGFVVVACRCWSDSDREGIWQFLR